MSKPEGIIIIVTRNNLHLTKKAIKSALGQDIDCQVVLIDNVSTDGTVQWARTKPGLATIELMNQQSLSACWNLGLKVAWSLGYAHALVCNNDIELRPDAYRLLLANGGPFVTCVSVDTSEQADEPPAPGNVRPHPDFSCFLIRKEVTDKVGWFNEAYYPAYVEDCDYHVRMHRSGIEAISIGVPFLHHGVSTVKSCSPQDKHIIQRGADKNRAMFKSVYGCLPGTPEYAELFR